MPRQYSPNSRQQTREIHTGTKRWQAIREHVLVRDNHQCRKCSRVVVGRQAQVDHVDGNSWNNPADGSNWQLLCHVCHGKKTHGELHGYDPSEPKGCDADGWPLARQD